MSLCLLVSQPLSQPLSTSRLSVTPFTRMVFCFKYDDDDALAAINDALGRVNTKALKNMQGKYVKARTDEDLEPNRFQIY
jgi:hypothetical protein